MAKRAKMGCWGEWADEWLSAVEEVLDDGPPPGVSLGEWLFDHYAGDLPWSPWASEQVLEAIKGHERLADLERRWREATGEGLGLECDEVVGQRER